MKKKWKIMAGVLTVVFCMLIGCEKKAGKEDFLLISLKEDAGGEESDPESDPESEEEQSKETGLKSDTEAYLGQTVFEKMPSKDPETVENSARIDETADETADETVKTEEILVIHLCGAVAEPGVYLLPKDSRLYQAVEEAGGLLEEAGAEYINLADLLVDGEKIYIPTIREAEEAGLTKEESRTGQITNQSEETGNPSAEKTQTESVNDGKININTASAELLCTLPGVGSGKAEKIIAYREAYGEFKTTEDIMKVAGIKDKMFQKIKDLIVV